MSRSGPDPYPAVTTAVVLLAGRRRGIPPPPTNLSTRSTGLTTAPQAHAGAGSSAQSSRPTTLEELVDLSILARRLRLSAGHRARCGAAGSDGPGWVLVRMDSAFYNAATIAACRRGGARFSVTARMDPKIRRSHRGDPRARLDRIRYPQAIWDDDEQRWISDAEVAEIDYTAFASRRKQAVTARADRAPGPPAGPGVTAGQTELGPGLALPRRVHRQPVPDAAGRGRPPRPRHHRAGHRRPDRRPAGPPAVGYLEPRS